MDKVRAFIDETIAFYNCANLDEAILESYKMTGFDWIDARENDWDWRDVESMEFETRSALEFIRPELTPSQLALLDKWDETYQEWHDEGIFFKRYAEANRGHKWSWKGEREFAAKILGRTIPKSHWWYWPPEEQGNEK